MPKTDKKVIFQLHFWSMTNTLENIDKVVWVEHYMVIENITDILKTLICCIMNDDVFRINLSNQKIKDLPFISKYSLFLGKTDDTMSK